jgi:predicted DNA-binding transcriptional regulator YafY
MFTQEEASSMLLAGKLVEKMTDNSVRNAFESSLLKIKAVLNESEKDRLEDLYAHIEVMHKPRTENSFPDHFITSIQTAVVDKHVLAVEYFSNYNEELTKREVEPIGLFYYGASWHLIAWCKLRNGYRDFRVDRIKTLHSTGKNFDTRNLLSLKEYLMTFMQNNREVEKVVVVFDKAVAKYCNNSRYSFGFVSEEDLDRKVRMTFLVCHLYSFCRWLLTFGNGIVIETPEKAKEIICELVEELSTYHLKDLKESMLVADN